MIELASGTNTVTDKVIYSWNLSELAHNQVYTLRLTARDCAGNEKSSAPVSVLVDYNSEKILPELTILTPTENSSITEEQTEFTYNYLDASSQSEEISDAKLIVNGTQAGALGDSEKKITFDASAYDSNAGGWRYPEGKIAFFYVQGKNASGEDVFSNATYREIKYTEDFKDNKGILSAENIVCSGGAASLDKNNGAYASSGSFIVLSNEFAGNINYVDLIVNENKPSGTNITYQISVDGGLTWENIVPVSTDEGKTLNKGNRKYFLSGNSGHQVKLKVTLTTGNAANSPSVSHVDMDLRYTLYSTFMLINNGFSKNERGFTQLIDTEHDEQNSCIKLKDGKTQGSVRSTVRSLSHDIVKAVLEVETEDEDADGGASITYELSTNGGLTYSKIDPGSANNVDDWEEPSSPGKTIILRATIKSSATKSPKLKSWKLHVKCMASGRPYTVKIVDAPSMLSALSGANYQTLLRWKPSATQDVTYNVYRSETPYFTPSASTLASEGLNDPYWSDYNLNYNTTFYYQVTAVKKIKGRKRESLPSNQASGTVVAENEVQKRLGLQDYWSYAGFKTGSGDGYVNVSNGNLSYITTDLMVSDPFFASVMRRTYNSMATSKTPMGYGWDFSFNTCLLREYDKEEKQEVGMILKDGDGSFHRFPLTENGEYDSAKGTLMRLEHDEENGEYTITRKDNIVYHFDENSMKLLRFSNPNGNELEFAYDERGNLKSVKNTVGEEIILTYNTAQENPRSEDYIYKNDHVDMLKTVSWTQSASDEPKSIVYHYEYNDKDKLTKAYTLIEGNDEYAESFTYDEDNELSAITNPENNTYALLCTNGKIDKVTDPVGNDMLLRYFSGKTVVMDQNGAASSYIFDGEGRVTKKVDPLNHEINYTYNDDFQVTGVSYDNIVLNENKTISYSYTYDENGNLTGVTGSGGSSVQYEGYNKWNKPQTVKVKKADNSWLITSYTYDEQGNLESTTDPTQKVSVNEYAKINGEDGYLVSSTDRLGKKTVYTYNAKGQVTQINEQNANGTEARRAAQYTYDAYGHTATSTDALNNTTSYTYNKLGFLIETQFADESTVSSTYSLTGNILSQTNARGNTVYYAYDDAGRLTQTKYKRMENGALVDKIISSIAYQRWDSDDDGILDADRVVETDGMGVASMQYYDKAGRMVKKTSGGVTVQYEYDKIGNVVKVTDGDGRVTRAQYDENGNNVKIEKVSLQAGVENIENTFLYDLLGNKTSEKDANGAETSYEYDELNRLKKVTQYLSATEPLYTSYEYDIINGKNIINRVTDAKGNVDETWFDVFGRKVKDRSIGSASMITSYSYDENNRLTEVERNDGSKEENEYDELGQA